METGTPRLVTPEAVELQFETAGLGSRLLAGLIDLAIQAVVLTIALIALLALVSSGTSFTLGFVVVVLVITVVLLGYPIAFESLWRGRTPGKAALGLRVVTTDGAPIRFRHAAVRGFLVLVDLYLTSGAGAVLSILFTRDNQRLGDLAAGTLVLRQRTGAQAPTATAFAVPPGYEAYAATLDPAGLSGDDHVAVRSYLLRAASLPLPTRTSLATQLATAIAARMGHSPPSGTNPEAFLACVAAVHQARWTPAGVPWPAGVAQPAATPPGIAPPAPAGPAPGPSTVPGRRSPAEPAEGFLPPT